MIYTTNKSNEEKAYMKAENKFPYVFFGNSYSCIHFAEIQADSIQINLAELTGSEKQIECAEKIRAKMIEKINRFIEYTIYKIVILDESPLSGSDPKGILNHICFDQLSSWSEQLSEKQKEEFFKCFSYLLKLAKPKIESINSAKWYLMNQNRSIDGLLFELLTEH